ncbi:MAG: redox-sensing transcriptional repressor Rex [Selenomonadaceae bacterium]|nr:redox-sensing transcriptional repressor Rex [Selenomonadaceae bacterium]
MEKKISQATLNRLPIYYRILCTAAESGIEIISSHELGKILNITPEQIRKDLTSFGNFGKKGIGYEVNDLKNKIENILGLQYHWRLGIVGAGHLGAALANYKNFPSLGFQIVALFDVDERIIGSEINGVKIYDFKKINSVATRKLVDIGVIAVSDIHAQKVADALVKAGVLGIWNFAPIKLNVPPQITLVNEDLSIGLTSLSYHLAQK